MRAAAFVMALLVFATGSRLTAVEPPSYSKDIKPFLNKYCMECHNSSKAKSGYSVETLAALMKNGRKGSLVVAGKPDESRILAVMQGRGKPMPPKRSEQPPRDEIAKVRAWIEAGAKDDTPADDEKKKRAGAQ